MDLFELYNNKVIPSAHALILEPYKSIWEKDNSEDKAEAINIFTYIELLCSPKKSNPYFGVDVSVRPKQLKKRIWGDENYISEVYSVFEILRAVDAYKTDLVNSSASYQTLVDAIEVAYNTRDHLKTIDLNATTNSGTLLLKPKDVTSALKEIPEVVKSLETARDLVLQEMKEDARSRNNREIGIFER